MGLLQEREERAHEAGKVGVVFCPVFVFGPMVHEIPRLETFGGTPADWFKAVVKGETAGTRQPAKFGFVIQQCLPSLLHAG